MVVMLSVGAVGPEEATFAEHREVLEHQPKVRTKSEGLCTVQGAN